MIDAIKNCNTFPGRSAARSDALQTRDRYKLVVFYDPGSAVHHHSARKTRVNAFKVLHRIREAVPKRAISAS